MSTIEIPGVDRIEIPGVESGNMEASRVMHRVTEELSEIAVAVDRVSEASHPTMELLEASRAIQSALVSLNNWRELHGTWIPAMKFSAGSSTLKEAWIAARFADPLDGPRSIWMDV
jgi:hypothetical protein